MDTPVDLVAGGNADGKRPCLGNGQTVLTRPPTQVEFVECWSEVIIRCGLSPDLVDNPLFRKAPGGKDLSKMKTQYEMFVDTVGSKQVTV